MLRAGLLVNSSLRQWQVQALQQMMEAGATIDTVIVNEERGRGPGQRFLYNLRKSPGYLFLAGSREIAIRLFGAHPYLQDKPISEIDLLKDARWLQCAPVSRSDLGQEVPQRVVEECRELDFLVRFGFGVLRGDVLDAPRYGVFSYHHGDLRAYRGRPAGFWEYMNDEESVGVTLQQLTETLDGGRIIKVSTFGVDQTDSYGDVLNRLYQGGTGLLAHAVGQIREEEFEPERPDTLGTMYRAPGMRAFMEYMIKETWALCCEKERRESGGSTGTS